MPNMSEEDGMKVAGLEVAFAELDGYSAEARAGELLLGVDIPTEMQAGLMSAVGAWSQAPRVTSAGTVFNT